MDGVQIYLALGLGEVGGDLRIEPEVRVGVEVARKAQRCVGARARSRRSSCPGHRWLWPARARSSLAVRDTPRAESRQGGCGYEA